MAQARYGTEPRIGSEQPAVGAAMAYFAFRLGHHGGAEAFERSRVFAEDAGEAVEIAVSWATHERRFWNERADASNWPLIVWAHDGLTGCKRGALAYYQADVRPREWVKL